MISRAQEPEQLYAKGGIASIRQPYFLGKAVKKLTKGVKKIAKSPVGKAALLGGLGFGIHKGMMPGGWGSGWGTGLMSALKNPKGMLAPLFRKKLEGGAYGGVHLGKLGMLGLLGAGTALPFMADEEEEIIETPWEETPSSIANLRDQARNYYRAAAPDYIGSPFMIDKQFVKPDFYAAKGGRAGIANGGNAAQAQAEQMLRMEYQKYRNQGGTMSYQQFKMTVLKQAQQQGPMAQAQPQMMNKGGRVGLLGGGVPRSHVAGYTTPAGYNRFDYPTGGVRVGAANGGIMPLLDLGGKEKDYRNEGGFVGIGRKEKADDVPARLSKNEFVFTADAVRNAGGGDIDAGAEVMENMMNHLEAGGQISEESQGIGAQGMYDNMRQLETRMG